MAQGTKLDFTGQHIYIGMDIHKKITNMRHSIALLPHRRQAGSHEWLCGHSFLPLQRTIQRGDIFPNIVLNVQGPYGTGWNSGPY